MPANQDPAIFHITHISNLASIVRCGCLWCDAERRKQGFAIASIAHEHIKQRRLKREVPLAAAGTLGNYVPFNFCPRSVMLLPAGNNAAGGPSAIIHLVSSTRTAASLGQPWTYTDRHAELAHAVYFDDLADLNQLDWEAIGAKYWNAPEVKECKQAEFLVYQHFSWSAVTAIGVYDQAALTKVAAIIATARHRPHVHVSQAWYY